MQSAAAAEPSPQPAFPPLEMSRRRKAALIVQLLISDGGKLQLSSLPDQTQEALARELGAIRLVDRTTVQAVASEFADILAAVGLSAPGGANAAIDALSAHLSPQLADRLRQQAAQPDGRDPWTVLTDLDPERIGQILERESPSVGAIVVSKLPVAKAAKALAAIPGERARRITFAMSRTTEVAPATVRRIGDALVRDYCKPAQAAFAKPPPDRVGAILNSATAAMREDLLSGLDSEDKLFASDVRKSIFTFIDIPDRLVPTDIPGATREVAPEVLTRALGYALSEDKFTPAAEFILSNISQRMAGQFREDIQENGPPNPEAGEAAMNEVTAAIRDMADEGTITLIPPKEDS